MLQFLNNLPLNEETMKKRWTLLYRVCTYDTKKSPFGPALDPPNRRPLNIASPLHSDGKPTLIQI